METYDKCFSEKPKILNLLTSDKSMDVEEAEEEEGEEEEEDREGRMADVRISCRRKKERGNRGGNKKRRERS